MSETTPTPTPIAPVRPHRRRHLVLAALTFMAGLFLGIGVTFAVGHHLIRDRMRHPEKIPAHITARVKRDLNLTPEQTAKVAPIISLHFEQIRKIIDEGQPRVQEQFDLLDQEISAVLTDEQKPVWHKQLERLRHMGPPPLTPPPSPANP
jgi:hypothetical protein